MTPCLFCGRSNQPPSKEDVLPRWARKAFNIQGLVDVQLGGMRDSERPERLLERRQHLTLFLRDAICEQCNNRLGRHLEQPVSKFLAPMAIHTMPTELDPTRQALVATWATKTVFLIELAVRQHYPGRRAVDGYVPSEPEFAWLFDKLEPPPRSRVWISCFDAQNSVNLRHEACLIALPGSSQAHLTTFTLGYVVFQVFSINYLVADALGLPEFNDVMPEPLQAVFTQIWPTGLRPVAWPTAAFNEASWAAVASWPSSLPKGEVDPETESRRAGAPWAGAPKR